jgi:hypothetical protein
LEKATADLLDYAVDREDIKWLLARVPQAASVPQQTVAYELQILKIIGVGWGLSFYLPSGGFKQQLQEAYWAAVRDVSRQLSSAAGLLAGQDIDYFQVLKERLETYVEALENAPEAPEPAAAIAPVFAASCGNGTDLFALHAGKRMFTAALTNVRAYLETIKYI